MLRIFPRQDFRNKNPSSFCKNVLKLLIDLFKNPEGCAHRRVMISQLCNAKTLKLSHSSQAALQNPEDSCFLWCIHRKFVTSMSSNVEKVRCTPMIHRQSSRDILVCFGT